MSPRRWSAATLLVTGSMLASVVAWGSSASAASPGSTTTAPAPAVAGPAPAYDCNLNLQTDAFTGAFATASAIGWAGNHQGVVTCLGGTFFVQNSVNKNFGFGIYNGAPTTWTDADGYLPAQITTFARAGATVSITEFADKLTLGGDAYVAVYCRVKVRNPTATVVTADPEPSAALVPLNTAPNAVAPHGSSVHDYVLAVDRFGNSYRWPTRQTLAAAGSFDRHFSHMRAFWNQQLAQAAGISVPDTSLDNAYRSGFIAVQIARSGTHLNTGVNGYEMEFNHDVVGILATLFTEGDFSGAHALLLEARNVIGAEEGQYADGTWDYSWPWAIYLMKTGDLSFVKANFASEGPSGAFQPSIEDTAHAIAADRTGPGGIMGMTNDIDTNGYWTIDDYEALMGLIAYRYLAQRVGDQTEVTWATDEYSSLLAATNQTLDATIASFHLSYLPCSILAPNTSNRCDNPEDANWAAPYEFGKWAWDGQLFDAPVNGPGLTLIDATYSYGFGRLKGLLPPNTLGGFPTDYYSTAYNAGYGSWGLASARHRDQGILGYEFIIANDQSGPYSWWESSSAPTSADPWSGSHPAAGQGASPHGWAISQDNKVLLDSLIAQRADGTVIVGRGVPSAWLRQGAPMTVTNFPTLDGHRLGIKISPGGLSIALSLSGHAPPGPVLFQLPSFVDNMAGTSSGQIDETSGTVTISSGTRSVTVHLRHLPAP